MARMGRFNSSDMKRLQKELQKLQGYTDEFVEACAKELAARLLAKVIKRTPSDTGNLRRGWTAQKSGSGSEGIKTRGAKQYVDTIEVHHYDDTYVIEIMNPVEYSSYVEYGHRTANHRGWVPGRFMMTISEREIEQSAPQILERKLKKFLGDALK